MARGLFAELNHQMQLAARRQEQAIRAAQREQLAAERRADAARKSAERAAAQWARATAAERKAAEREAKRLHDEAMLADAEAKNATLASVNDEIGSMLYSTLSTDDYVDLESLRVQVAHPAFDFPHLELPTPLPAPLQPPSEPIFVEPVAPTGLSALLGGKKRHAESVAAAKGAFEADYSGWLQEVEKLPKRRAEQVAEHKRAEQNRLELLEKARRQYEAECMVRQRAADESNERLDELIRGLSYNVDSAIQDYVGIVLGNSVYPESFPVDHQFIFDSATKELSLVALVPPPDALPTEKVFRYVKARNEVVGSLLSKKEQKDRYANAVYQVALRTIHEIFEADRARRIETISLTVGTESIDPATGNPKRTPFIAVASERGTFLDFDLANVIPLSTLQHMNAQISKNPFELVAIDTGKGIRGP